MAPHEHLTLAVGDGRQRTAQLRTELLCEVRLIRRRRVTLTAGKRPISAWKRLHGLAIPLPIRAETSPEKKVDIFRDVEPELSIAGAKPPQAMSGDTLGKQIGQPVLVGIPLERKMQPVKQGLSGAGEERMMKEQAAEPAYDTRRVWVELKAGRKHCLHLFGVAWIQPWSLEASAGQDPLFQSHSLHGAPLPPYERARPSAPGQAEQLTAHIFVARRDDQIHRKHWYLWQISGQKDVDPRLLITVPGHHPKVFLGGPHAGQRRSEVQQQLAVWCIPPLDQHAHLDQRVDGS